MTKAREFNNMEDVLSYCHCSCTDVRSVVIKYYWAEAGPNVSISVLCMDDTSGKGYNTRHFFASGSPGRYVETDHLLSEAELEAMFDGD